MTLLDWLLVIGLHAGLTWFMLHHYVNKGRKMFLETLSDPATIALLRDAVVKALPSPFAAMLRKD